MYTREQVKAITDKVIDMAKADAVEVQFTGGERSGTRWANSSITTNLVQFDRNVTATVRIGQKVGTANTRDISDAGLKAMVDEAMEEAKKATDSPNLPELLGAQEYIPVDSALPNMVGVGPAERARLVKTSLDIAASKGVVGAGYIPKNDMANCTANSKGLFAYYRSADLGFVLTCRMPDGSGSGFAAISGVKDFSMIDAAALTESAAGKALRSRGAKAMEPGRYTVILESRASARFLSLMTNIFGGRGGGFGGGGGGGRGGGAPAAGGPPAGGPPGGAPPDAAGGGGGGGGLFAGIGGAGSFMQGKKPGDKIFSDAFTLKSDIGNPILRQSTIGPDNKPAAPVTWVENGVLRTLGATAAASTNQSLVQGGTDLSVEDMIKQTRRGLLVTSFWYIRGVPSQEQPLLNTGMTRDGLFLIENGEIVGPVQNFRWNMSPLVGYNNLTLVGKPVPMLLGESFDSGNAALVPPVRIEEFYMTSVSPPSDQIHQNRLTEQAHPMSSSRRNFIKTFGAGAALTLYSRDLFGQILADSPKGRVLETKFKGLADIVLGEAKLAGCTYSDVRFTMNSSLPGGTANFRTAGAGGPGGGFGGGGGGGGRGGGGRGGGGRVVGIPTDADRQAGGFGVRVVHSGVWGFASSPIVTEDEIRRVTRVAVEVAKASAIAKRADLKLAPVQAYQQNYITPMIKHPSSVSATDKQAWAQAIVDKASKVAGVTAVNVSANHGYEWRYFASSEGSYIEQELFTTTPTMTVTAKVGDNTRTRNYPGVAGTGGWEIAENCDLLDQAEKVATDAVEMCTAKPLGSSGLKDLILSPSHAMLTIHEIVAHATELDRIVGYEANYAGTSFVKLADLGKLKYGSKIFNVTCDKTSTGLGTVGFDDDGVKTQKWPLIRDGVLVGLQTNRETAHLIGEKESRGCTFGSTWRDYPFLRMPNVHVEPGPANSPTRDELIADVKDGVMIDGRGSYSIDQQRYNGQFGGHIFWEIKNGKITRQVTDVTYNAITTDFWANLDGITGPKEWQMHGTGGDAKGQPTQTNSISHGSPWLCIRKIQVGAAFDG